MNNFFLFVCLYQFLQCGLYWYLPIAVLQIGCTALYLYDNDLQFLVEFGYIPLECSAEIAIFMPFVLMYLRKSTKLCVELNQISCIFCEGYAIPVNFFSLRLGECFDSDSCAIFVIFRQFVYTSVVHVQLLAILIKLTWQF